MNCLLSTYYLQYTWCLLIRMWLLCEVLIMEILCGYVEYVCPDNFVEILNQK